MAADRWTPLATTALGGLAIVTASRAQLVDALTADQGLAASAGGRRRPRLVFDANGHALSLRARDPAYRAALDRADVVHADGGFLVTLSRWLGGAPIAERSATTDMIHDVAAAAARHGVSFYLLGGTEAANAECAMRLGARYPGLRIAGRRHGYFRDAELDGVIDDLCAATPDVIWVGLGKPREQAVALAIAERVAATWIVTCGGCFDFVAGGNARAPMWMQMANLEWLHRLSSDPRRLFWRYAVTSPHALWLVAVNRLRAMVRGPAPRPRG